MEKVVHKIPKQNNRVVTETATNAVTETVTNAVTETVTNAVTETVTNSTYMTRKKHRKS